ncbi:MAG: S8 family peptidase [Verrucomicrobiales bacterium]
MTKPFQRFLFAMAALALLAVGIYVLIGPGGFGKKGESAENSAARPWSTVGEGYRASQDIGSRKVALSSDDAPAREGEVLVRFKDDAEYLDFLARAEKLGLKVLGRIDGLRTARLAIVDPERWAATQEKEKGEFSPNYLVYVPDLPEGSIQDGAVGFGADLLGWLGIDSDNSKWGTGVTVAILDSGVVKHPGITANLTTLNLLGEGVVMDAGHGTGVASLIAGSSSQTPGLAPSANLLSIAVVDASGVSDTFLVAQGIMEAVNGGAGVINVSLGSQGDSQALRDAVAYARERGVVIVASAGNNGVDSIAYPAAYEGVLAVGSVDARGEKLDFSNSGWALDVAAPGLELNVAWPGDQVAGFTGTSASAPIISGAIAAAMSQYGISANQASALVLANLNEAGALGADTGYGGGILDVGRVMSSSTPGIVDLAVANQSLSVNASGGTIETIVQNRGTASIPAASLTVTAAGKQTVVPVPALAPGESASRTVRLGTAADYQKPGATILSSVSVSEGSDAKPSNNSRTSTVQGK